MKRYALLIVILLVSFSSTSQTVIPNTSSDECAVCLDSIQAAAAAKDLISGDAAKAENLVLHSMLDNLELSVEYHSEKNLKLQEQNNNLKLISDEQQKQNNLLEAKVESQEAQNKKERRETTFYKITTVAALFLAGAVAVLTN